MRGSALLVVALLAAAMLAACGSSDDDGGSGSSGAAAESSGGEASGKRLGLALAGPRNDRGFYQSAYEGAQAAAKQYDVEVSVVDALEDPQAQLEALTNLSADNDLVIGGGAAFAEAAKTLAPQNPDVEYVVLTGVVEAGTDNLHAYVPRQGVPAYIAGVVAAELTKTGKLGFIGGAEIPPTDASDLAFEAGAKAQKSGTEVASTTIGSFTDAAKAKEAAKAQLAGGADQIFAFLDAALAGTIQAIDESGTDAVGLYNPIALHCEDSPSYVGTAVLRVDLLVEELVRDWNDGNLPDGTKFLGVEEPEIQRFELCPEAAKDEKVVELVETTTEKLNNDEIELPEGV
jgi:basic membrane protein A